MIKRSPSFHILILFLCSSISLQAQLLPKQKGYYRIAVLGCHRQFEPAPALARYLEVEPDLCLWIGDNVYADAPEDPSYIKTCYDALAAKPAFQELMKSYDYMATWDDHDFGLNDAGKEYPFKQESKALFRTFWGLENVIPQDQDGIYYARMFEVEGQKLQIIMLDGRYNRDAPDGTGDVLGEQQWMWLEEQLKQEADLRIVVSGFQILLTKEAGSETWDKFPIAKARLWETIRKAKAEGVIFLTGDQHYGEVCRLPDALDYDAIELQFAGINQIEKAEFNPLRVAPVIKSKHSVAVIDIQFDETKREVSHLLFQVADAQTNQLELAYRVNLAELQLKVDFTSPLVFANQHQVELSHTYPELAIRYTTDGSKPALNSPIYTKAISLSETTTIKAQLFDGQYARSAIFEQTYEKLEPIPALTKKSNLIEGLRFQYIEGNFEKLPDFSQFEILKSGVTETLDVSKLANREDHYAILFEGFLEVPTTGVYDFSLISDDGSKLFVAEKQVVDNDGSHSTRLRTGLIALEKGVHPLRIEYFEDYSGQTLHVGFVGPDGKQQLVTDGYLYCESK